MPSGADTVFMQEDTREENGRVIVPAGLKRGANARLAGEDVRKGSTVMPAGRRLAAQDVALAAAVGMTSLKVRRRVRVALFSTGDEIVEPGTPRPDSALYDANRYLLGGMLEIPGTPWRDAPWAEDEALAHAPLPALAWRALPGEARHGFTHFELTMALKTAEIPAATAPEGHAWQDAVTARAALPTVMRRLLDLAADGGA